MTVEWRALEVDIISNIFKQSTHDGDHVFQCKAGRKGSPVKGENEQVMNQMVKGE